MDASWKLKKFIAAIKQGQGSVQHHHRLGGIEESVTPGQGAWLLPAIE
jgi:hypothetical protein